MSDLRVVIKTTEPLRIAEGSATAPGFGHDNLGPVFQRLIPMVLGHLGQTGARPGIMVAWYEEPADDGSVVLHTGFDIADQDVADGDAVRVVDLPRVKVASVLHRGSMEDVGLVYEALVQWIADSGIQIAGRSRELYLQWDDTNPDGCSTEIQMPVAP
jgi:effector-binding domain-containing protein